MNVKWTESEKSFIRDNAEHMLDKDIAVRLTEMSRRTVSLQAVRKMRQKLGIKKCSGRSLCKVVENGRVLPATHRISENTDPETSEGPTHIVS